MEKFDLIIIGAGPAGLFCAINASCKKKLKIAVLEKNSSPGRKFLLSGSGQCNITHAGNAEDFVRHYGDSGIFVKAALKSFPPSALIEFLDINGIPVTERGDGKIFPESMRGADVLNMMISLCVECGVEIVYDTAVNRVLNRDGVFYVYTRGGTCTAESVVISTGGESYPSTGSTGDGFRFAREMGHSIVETTPALAPVFIRNFRFGELSGVSLKGRGVSLYRDGKRYKTTTGDILFTPGGLSGPAILDISRYISCGDIIEISFTDENIDVMNESFIAESRVSGATSIKRFIKRYNLPERLITLILEQEGIDPQRKVSEINRGDRLKITRSLSGFPFIVEKKGGFNIAMATSGGVCRDQINRVTMESELVEGLYFAGEVIDVDGDTGGFNIQWAFSSAKAAADRIIQKKIP